MFSTQRCLRTGWAAKAWLLLGLFGLVVGSANACVQHELQQGVSGHAQHLLGDADPHQCNALLDDCESLCDAPQNLLPKSQPQRLLDGSAWPPAIVAFAAAWAVDRTPVPRPPQTRISPPSPSVVLRFLRLTL
jgi:hypothetical protein